MGVALEVLAGKISGVSMDSAYSLAPMIGLEVKMDSKISLRGFWYPVAISSVTLANIEVHTTKLNNGVIIGFTYLL